MLKLADLASRADFDVGPLHVSPSRRLVEGPAGQANLQPIVMKVFLLLLDARNSVVTRDELFGNAWGGVYVGDDSLNRAIAGVRRIASDTAPGLFEIETIPRTGYRLTGDIVAMLDDGKAEDPEPKVSRRTLIVGGAGGLLLVGSGTWWAVRSRSDAQFDRIVDRAEAALRNEDLSDNVVRSLETAVSMRPESAKAWGLLALFRALLVDSVDPRNRQRAIAGCENAARRALALDSKQPDALLAMFELQGSTLDWITRDRKLRQIILVAPHHFGAIHELGELTAATGLVRESWQWNERGLALEPLSPDFLGKRALKLWVLGRTADADKVSDRLRALYPNNPFGWFIRAQIYAFTHRVPAALAMLDNEPMAHGPSPMASLWRASLPALDDRSPSKLARARDACIRAGGSSSMAANEAILIMSALGEVDTAFDIANATLLSRGPLVARQRAGPDQAAADADWRINTQWMWAPPVAAMRADPRFAPLCDEIGLSDYWRQRGVKPDYMLSKS